MFELQSGGRTAATETLPDWWNELMGDIEVIPVSLEGTEHKEPSVYVENPMVEFTSGKRTGVTGYSDFEIVHVNSLCKVVKTTITQPAEGTHSISSSVYPFMNPNQKQVDDTLVYDSISIVPMPTAQTVKDAMKCLSSVNMNNVRWKIISRWVTITPDSENDVYTETFYVERPGPRNMILNDNSETPDPQTQEDV
jgi:hypothetical protein